MSTEKKPRLEPLPTDTFCFECGPAMACFTACCAKLDLQLTPYDILRLARRLEMNTGEFVDKHVVAYEEPGKLPRVALEMNDDAEERCPFVTEQGCTVYEDRPAACRTYPLARAASPSPTGGKVRQAFFLVREEHCRGFESSRQWTIEGWIGDQEVETYFAHNDRWNEILADQKLVMQDQLRDQKVKMFSLASYDLDKFRDFVFEGGLLDRLDIPQRLLDKIRVDDEELLRFAYAWLELALYGRFTRGLTRP